MNYSEDGWSGYPDAQEMMGSLIAGMGALAYTPDLGPVGHSSAYYPRDTSGDAAALNFLGFYPDDFLARHLGTTGSQRGDMAQGAGAWDPTFQTAVRDFQGTHGDAADGWIGPQTRTSLKQAVDAKNARESPIAPPQVIPGVPIPGVPSTPTPGGGAQPVQAKSNVPLIVGVVAGVGALGYAAWKWVF